VARENQSRSDLTKVAQPRRLSGLGNEAKNRSVPSASGTIEMLGLLVLHAAQRLPAFVDHPVRVRDGLLFKNANPALRTGLLSLSPPGQKSSPNNSGPYVDADGQPPEEIGSASLTKIAYPGLPTGQQILTFPVPRKPSPSGRLLPAPDADPSRHCKAGRRVPERDPTAPSGAQPCEE